jgi:hypothetical protein
MTVRVISDDGDIVTNGQQFTTGRHEIAQTVKTRLGLFLGEYFRDITDGTPWFEQILGKGVNNNTREAVLRNRIARTPGVIRLTYFKTDFDVESRKYSVTAGISTTEGMEMVIVNG